MGRTLLPRHIPRVSIRCMVVVLLAACASACDRPTATEPETSLNTISSITVPAPANVASCSGSPLGGTAAMKVKVRLSTGATAAGIVVTVISPEHGVLCYGATDGQGHLRFEGLKKYAEVLLSVRDEVGLNALALEIVPPNPVAAAHLADTPSLWHNRQEPALVGGADCTDVQQLTWAGYIAMKSTPCIVSGTDVVVKLTGHAPQLATRVLDASNQPLAGVIVAALSPATIEDANLPALCAMLPWIDQLECRTNSNGPALLQSLGLTDATGQISLGVSFGGSGQPVVIETIAEESGQTLFGTLFETASGARSLLTSPGMCTVTTVEDESEPAGRAELDIRSTAHSVGLATSIDPAMPLAAPALVPVNSTLVVKLNLHASTTGGAGRYTLQYRGAKGGMKTVRATFTIDAAHPELCSVSAASGNGVGGSVEFAGHCAPNPVQPDDVADGRRAYTLFFVLSGVADVKSATYDIRTDHDHLDPSRSHPAYDRGGVNFTGLDASTCPIRLNNDGRWIAL